MIYFRKPDGSIHGVDDGYDPSTVEGDFEVLKDFDIDDWKDEQAKAAIEQQKARDLISPPIMTPIYPGDPGWGENVEPEINPLFVEKYEADRKDLEKQYDELKSLGYSEELARKLSGYSETSILDDIDIKHKDKKRSK